MVETSALRGQAPTAWRQSLVIDLRSQWDGAFLDTVRAGRERCYERFGVGTAGQPATRCEESLVRYVTLSTSWGQIVGGLSVHQRGDGRRLPLEAALVANHPALLAKLRPVLAGPLVELSGTWLDPAYRGLGLSPWLIRSAMASLVDLDPPAALGFAHQHVASLYARFGFRALPFPSINYPDARYRSFIAGLGLADGRVAAPEPEGKRIHALTKELAGGGGSLRLRVPMGPAPLAHVIRIGQSAEIKADFRPRRSEPSVLLVCRETR